MQVQVSLSLPLIIPILIAAFSTGISAGVIISCWFLDSKLPKGPLSWIFYSGLFAAGSLSSLLLILTR
jgi:hypothetical protein